MINKDKEALKKYISLLSKFISREIDASKFENLFLETFKNEKYQFNDKVFQILDGLFADVDAFCANPRIREENDLDEHQLSDSVQRALNKLDQIE